MAMILGLSSGAQAGGGTATLTTGLLNPAGTNTFLVCSVVNVSTKEVSVTIEVLDQFGAIANSGSDPNLSPGAGRVFSATSAAVTGVGWCRFTVQGKASAVRATASIFEVGSGSIAAVAAQ